MKIKSIIIIALVIAFNDFVGAVLAQVGLLILKLGNLLTTIPSFL